MPKNASQQTNHHTTDAVGANSKAQFSRTLCKWAVNLAYANPDGEFPIISNFAKGQLMSSLAAGHVVMSVSKTELSLTFEVLAADARIAMQLGVATSDDAFLDAALPVLPLVDCHVLRADRLQERVKEIPDLLGLADIAAILGVSRQRVWQLSKSANFPAPAQKLRAGHFWRRKDVEAWIAGR